MSQTLATSALFLAGLTTRMFGWKPDDFWNVTPAELTAIFTIEEGQADTGLNRNELEALLERDANG
ncbi:hypothetical protein GCM10009127_07410 [Alteraurantiacibacter aestuarii]|uniref:Phage tail assembly chaperone n=1 Tax=Alteraurantiacibacter aestuarii TaxID=650004 RepID=A0A844ZHU4_9SPHN|nr:phage tail assembly chaperone [Alteraurantiacibacter aestuarii]MXO87134.1 phage tail assembly chaperone [Alteraurantiacibacter aestuarii]